MAKKLKILNFIGLSNASNGTNYAYDTLVHCITTGMKYEQVKGIMKTSHHCYIPEDQFNALETVINCQMNLDIGRRRKERSYL